MPKTVNKEKRASKSITMRNYQICSTERHKNRFQTNNLLFVTYVTESDCSRKSYSLNSTSFRAYPPGVEENVIVEMLDRPCRTATVDEAGLCSNHNKLEPSNRLRKHPPDPYQSHKNAQHFCLLRYLFLERFRHACYEHPARAHHTIHRTAQEGNNKQTSHDSKNWVAAQPKGTASEAQGCRGGPWGLRSSPGSPGAGPPSGGSSCSLSRSRGCSRRGCSPARRRSPPGSGRWWYGCGA